MNLVFDIFPADDVRGTRLVRLTSDDYLEGTMFRTELVGVGKGRLVLQADQAVVTSANLARDNYVEVFDLTLSGAYALGAFFLEEGDFDALSDREQAGRILTFGGRGELSYLSRGILGTQALSGAAGPFDQHYIDTTGQWDWGSDPATETFGAILRRIIYESALMTPDPLPEVQLVDITWDDNVDSDGAAWPPFLGRYQIPVGTNLLEAAAELLKHGIELVANSDFEYGAYNAGTYGTDRTSATFAAGKVRFEAGINIAADLSRAIHGATDASHAIVTDSTGMSFDTVTSPEYSGGDVVRYVGITATQDTGPEDLESLGENVLTNRRTFVDQFAFPHPTGYTPLSGLYTPGPPASAAHYWKGDYVTIHTGSSPYDASEQTIRVAAIEWNVDDAGNWLPTVELGAQYLSVGQANISGELTRLATSGHTHPPNPELCRAGIPGSSVLLGSACSNSGSNPTSDYAPWAGSNEERVSLTISAAVPTSASLIAITSFNQIGAEPEQVYDQRGNTWTLDAEEENAGSSNDDTVQVWRCSPNTALVAGDYVRFAQKLTGAGTGSVDTSGHCLAVYMYPGRLSSPVPGTGVDGFSGTAAVTAPAGEVVVAALAVADSSAAMTLTPDPDWQTMVPFALVGGTSVQNTGIYAQQLLNTASTSWSIPLSASQDWAAIAVGYDFETGVSAGDGHPDLVGTSIRASRCDHRHDVHRATAPTVNDDEADGYKVGTIWAQLDSLATPTTIDAVFILADASEGAAVWLELPTGSGGGTIDIEDEGSAEGAADTIDFTGAGVSVTFSGGEATVAIPGGGLAVPTLLQSIKGSADTPDAEFSSTISPFTAVDGSSGTVSLNAGSGAGLYDVATRSGWVLMQIGTAANDSVELKQDYTLPDGKCIVAYFSMAIDNATTASANNEFAYGIGVNDNDSGVSSGTAAQTLQVAADAEAAGLFRIIAFDGTSSLGDMVPSNVYVGGWFMRIDRSGLVYRAFVSHDGFAWSYLGTKTMSTAANNVWLFAKCSATMATRLVVGAPWFRQGTALAVDPWPL